MAYGPEGTEMPRRRTPAPAPQGTGATATGNTPQPSWLRRNWKKVAGWSAGLIIFLMLASTLSRPSEPVAAMPAEDFTEFKTVALKAGGSYQIPVPPGHRVDAWPPGLKEIWSEQSADLILTVSVEKDTEVKYRVYMCTALIPCHSERPKLTEEVKQESEKATATEDEEPAPLDEGVPDENLPSEEEIPPSRPLVPPMPLGSVKD